MTLIFCLDDRDGMTFNSRRQSRDREVIRDILTEASGSVLCISEYSKRLFADRENLISVTNAFSSDDEYCFIEQYPENAEELTAVADKIIIYRWNKLYPSDVRLWFNPEECGFIRSRSIDFPGHSHDIITKEIYTKL